MKQLIAAGLVSLLPLAMAESASAKFTGFAVNEYTSGTKLVADIYVTFDSTFDVLLNIFNVEASMNLGFGSVAHSNLIPGPSWAPQFVTPGMETMDSFVTIGGAPGFGNTTQADPNWGPAGFNQAGIPPLAGWFNSNPPNLQGKAQQISTDRLYISDPYDGPGTLVMRLVFDFSTLVEGPVLSLAGALTFNQGLSVPPQQVPFDTTLVLFPGVPAPGALAMLVLGALAGRSRRRR